MLTGRQTILICGGLLIVFAVVTWSAVQTKSPTFDEPYHAIAGWTHLRQRDFRLDTEDPPLWNMWAALLNSTHSIHSDFEQQDWSGLPVDTQAENAWAVQTLFRTPGNDAESFLRRSHAMMLIVGVMLGGAIAMLTWCLARSLGSAPTVAAVCATAFFCFDPNFLGHGTLIKNDVANSLAMLGLITCVWAAGRKLTMQGLVAMGVFCGIALVIKFSGVLIALIAAAVLLARAIFPGPWTALGRSRESRFSRLIVAIGAIGITALLSSAVIWITYGLRFSPGRDPKTIMDLSPTLQLTLTRIWQANHTISQSTPAPTNQDLDNLKLPFSCAFIQFANRHRLLPQAWLVGLLYTYQSTLLRAEFLLGRTSPLGSWWYFPFAIAVKTPLATLTAFFAAVFIWLARLRGRLNFDMLWATIVLALPISIYLAAGMSSNLNLGLRHVFPIYPLLFAVTGICAGWMWQSKPKLTRWLLPILLIGLIVESLTAYPDFIPFFNVAAGGSRGGLRLLSDSNLDWGQDLKLLAQWQEQHPQEKLYLAYFGTADPAYYGIRYTAMADGYGFGPPPQPINSPGVLAISATTLQGPYTHRLNGQGIYAPLWDFRPIEILGGSIYLFRFPPAPQDRLPPGQRLIN